MKQNNKTQKKGEASQMIESNKGVELSSISVVARPLRKEILSFSDEFRYIGNCRILEIETTDKIDEDQLLVELRQMPVHKTYKVGDRAVSFKNAEWDTGAEFIGTRCETDLEGKFTGVSRSVWQVAYTN
jgi:hypothetical protein